MGYPNPRDLEYFLAVVSYGSFTAAAQRMGVAQPAVSRAVDRIETALGTPILTRTTRSLELTTAGRALELESRSIITQLRGLSNSVGAGADNKPLVRVGADTSLLSGVLPQVIRRDTSVNYTLSALSQNDQREGLRNGTLDVGVCRTWVEGDLHHRLVFKEPLYALLPSDHRLADVDAVPLSELAHDRFALFSRQVAPVAFDTIMAACARAGFTPHIGQTERSEQAMFGVVAAGLGVSIMARMVANIWPEGVVARPLTDRRAVTPISVIAPVGDPRRHGRHVESLLVEALGRP